MVEGFLSKTPTKSVVLHSVPHGSFWVPAGLSSMHRIKEDHDNPYLRGGFKDQLQSSSEKFLPDLDGNKDREQYIDNMLRVI